MHMCSTMCFKLCIMMVFECKTLVKCACTKMSMYLKVLGLNYPYVIIAWCSVSQTCWIPKYPTGISGCCYSCINFWNSPHMQPYKVCTHTPYKVFYFLILSIIWVWLLSKNCPKPACNYTREGTCVTVNLCRCQNNKHLGYQPLTGPLLKPNPQVRPWRCREGRVTPMFWPCVNVRWSSSTAYELIIWLNDLGNRL